MNINRIFFGLARRIWRWTRHIAFALRFAGTGNRHDFLWSTTTAARDRPYEKIIEVVAGIQLRNAYGLVDGDIVTVELIIK